MKAPETDKQLTPIIECRGVLILPAAIPEEGWGQALGKGFTLLTLGILEAVLCCPPRVEDVSNFLVNFTVSFNQTLISEP